MTDGTIQQLRHTVKNDMEEAPGYVRNIVRQVLAGQAGLTNDQQIERLTVARVLTAHYGATVAVEALDAAIIKAEERKATEPATRGNKSDNDDESDEAEADEVFNGEDDLSDL